MYVYTCVGSSCFVVRVFSHARFVIRTHKDYLSSFLLSSRFTDSCIGTKHFLQPQYKAICHSVDQN